MKRVQHASRLEMDAAPRGMGLTTPQYAALAVLEGKAVASRAHGSVWEIEERMLGDPVEDERAWLLRVLRGCVDALERAGTGRRAG